MDGGKSESATLLFCPGHQTRLYYITLSYLLIIRSIAMINLFVGLNRPVVRARLAIFAGDLAEAEECYVKKAGQPELAISMYKQFNRWTEAVALAERTDRASVSMLKQQHMDYLTATGNLYIVFFASRYISLLMAPLLGHRPCL
jgi:hypothetical protein